MDIHPLVWWKVRCYECGGVGHRKRDHGKIREMKKTKEDKRKTKKKDKIERDEIEEDKKKEIVKEKIKKMRKIR